MPPAAFRHANRGVECQEWVGRCQPTRRTRGLQPVIRIDDAGLLTLAAEHPGQQPPCRSQDLPDAGRQFLRTVSNSSSRTICPSLVVRLIVIVYRPPCTDHLSSVSVIVHGSPPQRFASTSGWPVPPNAVAAASTSHLATRTGIQPRIALARRRRRLTSLEAAELTQATVNVGFAASISPRQASPVGRPVESGTRRPAVEIARDRVTPVSDGREVGVTARSGRSPSAAFGTPHRVSSLPQGIVVFGSNAAPVCPASTRASASQG